MRPGHAAPHRRVAWSLALLLALAAQAAGAAAGRAQEEVVFATDELEIETADGRRFAFTVELALTPRQRARGLMFRRELAADAGMLFLYRRDAPRRFWMKNTPLSLDILFLDARGRILSIAPATTPLSEEAVSSPAPARAVLEVPAGTAARLGLAPGDRVLHRAFTAAGNAARQGRRRAGRRRQRPTLLTAARRGLKRR